MSSNNRNPSSKRQPKDMPDVATSEQSVHQATLDWVGMSKIALPLKIKDRHLGDHSVDSRVQTYVNLANAETKGIHMSRLYLMLADFAKNHTLTLSTLKQFLIEKLASHEGISTQASVEFSFDYVIEQPALKSEYSGWKDYPVSIKAVYDGHEVRTELAVTVPYSSTCPCSAALARQLLQEAFADDFSDRDSIDKTTVEQWLRSARGSVATPHSQRSYAIVHTALNNDKLTDFPLHQLITAIESVLKTPVQTAVKREDEQEFARLNGANQMFCEDAAKRVKTALDAQDWINDFWLRVEHIESLHAHDAVAIATKGIQGGFSPVMKRL
ncbi:GTP cyclohydrolase FolE2 [bacterium]|nr:GTP cyclohydrolase FolE2 [bacterium]